MNPTLDRKKPAKSFFLFCFCFAVIAVIVVKTGSYVAQAGLNIAKKSRVILNF